MKLSPAQRAALVRLAAGPFTRTVAGWHRPDDGVHAFSTQTMTALADRGLVKVALLANRKRHWVARITDAGRRLAVTLCIEKAA